MKIDTDALLTERNRLRDRVQQLEMRLSGYCIETSEGFTTDTYRSAVGHEGPLAPEWKNKPHRLVFDLCRHIETLQAMIAGYRGAIAIAHPCNTGPHTVEAFRSHRDSYLNGPEVYRQAADEVASMLIAIGKLDAEAKDA